MKIIKVKLVCPLLSFKLGVQLTNGHYVKNIVFVRDLARAVSDPHRCAIFGSKSKKVGRH